MVLQESITTIVFIWMGYFVTRICCFTNDMEQDTDQAQVGGDPVEEKGPRKTIVGNSVVYKSQEGIAQEYSDCVICAEDFKDGEKCGVLYKCQHVYHKDCINKWLSKSKHCPLCRCHVIGDSSSPLKKES